MDVYGRKPASEEGKYFRANIWSWPAIRLLMGQLCGDLLDSELLEAMAFNDGAGPEDGDLCEKIAGRFDVWMEHNASGHTVECSEIRIKRDRSVVFVEELNEEDEDETVSPFRVSDEHLKEWITFLRHCGGFKVC